MLGSPSDRTGIARRARRRGQEFQKRQRHVHVQVSGKVNIEQFRHAAQVNGQHHIQRAQVKQQSRRKFA